MAAQQGIDLAGFTKPMGIGLIEEAALSAGLGSRPTADATAFLSLLRESGIAPESLPDSPANIDIECLSAFAWRIIREIGPLAAANRFHPKRLEIAFKEAVMRAFLDVTSSMGASEPGSAAADYDAERGQDDICSIDTLCHVISDVNAAAYELAFLRKCADEGAANSESLASASEKLFISVVEISQSTEEAAAQAAAADEGAASGRAAVQNAIAAMEDISNAVKDTATKLDDLSRASEQIGQILTLTNNIAGQTKLLALNATIEAARAGAAGRGFAVVASEVKRLAEQSAKASEEMTRRVTALHEGMENILKTMAQTNKAVSKGALAIGETGRALDTMSSQVSPVANRMGDITGILSNQSGLASNMARCVDLISANSKDAAKRLAAAAANLGAGTRSLAQEGELLRKPQCPRSGWAMAKFDHLLFTLYVTNALIDKKASLPLWILDEKACTLGPVLEAVLPKGTPSLPVMKKLHARVHAAARRVIEAAGPDGNGAALSLLSEFNDASNELIRCMDECACAR